MKIKYSIKRFRTIIDNQDIELDSNKINIILGVNGSGKSNILDSIRWFSGDENVKNIKSKTTEFHPDFDPSNVFLDAPKIIYTDELDNDEKEYILERLKKINIKSFNNNFSRYFAQYKGLYYKNLDVTENGLTDLGKIKEEMVLKFKNY